MLELHSKNFSILAHPLEQESLLEFDIHIGENKYPKIGFQEKRHFFKPLFLSLTNSNGALLKTQKSQRYAEIVGGLEASYLGYFFLSPGYTTFIFFLKPDQQYHVVMTGSNGDVLNHSEIDPSSVSEWAAQLKSYVY